MSTQKTNERYERMVTPIERFFVHSPFSIVTMVARIKGNVTASMLTDALHKVQKRHPLLRSRIREDKDHAPWFTTEEVGEIPIEIVSRESDDDWIAAVKRSSQIPFEFETQPAIRFILVRSPKLSELVILCHHLICDGLSLAYLARDMMHHLGDPEREVQILPAPSPISLNNLPEDVKQSGLIKYFINRMNRNWETQKMNFDQEDYLAITDAYWKNFQYKMFSIELSEAQTTAIIERCRKESVSVNSALTVAFTGAQSLVQGEQPSQGTVVVAANLRDRLPEPVGEGMGFYAGGVKLNYRYDHKQSFYENARSFHKKAVGQYKNQKLFNEALTWSFLEPEISEALNFKKIGALVPEENPRHKKLTAFSKQDDVVSSILKREKMDTFDSIILGTAITNLTRMDFPRKYGKLELDRMIFKPGGGFPLSNIYLLLGAVTCSGKLSIIGEYSDKNFDDKTMESIKEQARSFLLGE